jgi:hypothetical protein
MVVEHQKSKRLSYMAKFKSEAVQYVEEKQNQKKIPHYFLELIKATSDCSRNTRQSLVSVRHHDRYSLDPRKDDFLKLMMQSS